ncbi:unnamed protein product [Effrenium voratum]|nr:unnamed protein product [Effrenium voratum]
MRSSPRATRQCVIGSKACWKELEPDTRQALARWPVLGQLLGRPGSVWVTSDLGAAQAFKDQVLLSLTKEPDPSLPVRRNAGSVVSSIAHSVAEDFQELIKEWPQLLPFLSTTVSNGQPPQVTACIKVLCDMVELVGEELLSQGPNTVTMLQTCLSSAPGEVRAAAAQLVFQMVEDLEPEAAAPLGALMPQIILAIKAFAVASEHEDILKETLESLISAADEEPEFFKENGLQDLWPLLLEMCKADHWADPNVRHSAMEAVMSFFEGFCEDFCKTEAGLRNDCEDLNRFL